MAYEVELTEMASTPLIAVERRLKASELSQFPGLVGPVWEHIRANGLKPSGHNAGIFRYRGAENGEAQFDVSFGVQVESDGALPEGLVRTETPSGRCAHVAYYGAYTGLGQAHDAIRDWSRTTGTELTDTSWEVYGDWSDDPAQLRTDIYYSLKGA